MTTKNVSTCVVHSSHNDPEEIYEFAQPFGLILDIGCGKGEKMDYLARINTTKNVIGIDIEKEILKYGQHRICGDAQYLPFKSNIFDSVICSEVLEHLPCPERCIKEIKRVLKKGGIVFFSTPILNINIPFLISIYRKVDDIKLEGDHPHLHVFSTKRLCNMIIETDNLNIVKVRHLGYTAILKRLKRSKFEELIYRIDICLYNLSKYVSIIRYFAAQVWVKCAKYERY